MKLMFPVDLRSSGIETVYSVSVYNASVTDLLLAASESVVSVSTKILA